MNEMLFLGAEEDTPCIRLDRRDFHLTDSASAALLGYVSKVHI